MANHTILTSGDTVSYRWTVPIFKTAKQEMAQLRMDSERDLNPREMTKRSDKRRILQWAGE